MKIGLRHTNLMRLITNFNDQMNQFFINELKCRFNLRRPKSQKPTNVYMVVYLNGKQHYYATGIKVYPSQWNQKKQVAVISNIQSTLDNLNNKEANERIAILKGYFSEYKQYLTNNTDALSKAEVILRTFIYKKMNNNMIKGTELLNKAFNYYYSYFSRSKAESTRKAKRSQLDLFLKYVKYVNLPDDTNLLSQKVLNSYRDFLKSESGKDNNDFFGGGIEYVNQCCQLLSLLINKILASENEFAGYGILPVNFKPFPLERIQEEKPRFPITTEEIEKIKNCQGLKPKEEVYRDIFLLQIECGQRVSDLIKVIKREFDELDGFIYLKTKKEGTTAYFLKTKSIDAFFDKYKSGMDIIGQEKIETLDTTATYNNNIKRICEKAGLYRMYNYTDPRKHSHTDKICDIITNHCARHTFVVLMKHKGYTADEICRMTGHTDDKMVRDVYGHYGVEDEIKKLKKATARVNGETETRTEGKKSTVIESVFGYSKLMQLKDLQENDTVLRNLPITKECIQIILSTSTLTKAIEYSKDKDLAQLKERAMELYDIVKSLTMLTFNPNIYHIYEYKLFKFGFIKDMLPTDMIEEMFREPTEDELAQSQLEEHLKYLSRLNDKMGEENDASD